MGEQPFRSDSLGVKNGVRRAVSFGPYVSNVYIIMSQQDNLTLVSKGVPGLQKTLDITSIR